MTVNISPPYSLEVSHMDELMTMLRYRVTVTRKYRGEEPPATAAAGEGGAAEGAEGVDGTAAGTVSEAGTLHTKRHSGDHHDIAAVFVFPS
jgi:hypothetical protein